jgi:hypothetical protein
VNADGTIGDLVGSVSIRGLASETASGEVGYWVRTRPLEQLELIHSVGNQASCRVAGKAGFALSAVLPPLLPGFPADGHLHIRPAAY